MSMNQPGSGSSQQVNAGAYTKRVYAFDSTPVGAGHGGSGTEIVGASIERCDPNVALSCVVTVPAKCVLASGHTATFHRSLEHSDDGTSWSTYGTDPDDVVVAANNDGSAVDTDIAADWNIDLSGAAEFVRVEVTPTLSASGTDVVTVGAATVVLMGFDTNPNADTY